MQRMLALPVSPCDEAGKGTTDPPPPSLRLPMPMTASLSASADHPVPREGVPAFATLSTPGKESTVVPAPRALTDSATSMRANVTPATGLTGLMRVDGAQPVRCTPEGQDAARAGTPSEPSPIPVRPMGMQPIVWTNRAFDWWATRCGPLGLWLCGPAGRTLLGCTGLLLLAGALAWALHDWIGWTW
jgi:hypothetical protein